MKQKYIKIPIHVGTLPIHEFEVSNWKKKTIKQKDPYKNH
jgi:hypothetical protein